MRKDIHKGDCYKVTACGTTHYIPVRACGDKGDNPGYNDLKRFLENWIEEEDVTSISRLKDVWISRDGYADVTYWSVHRSYKDASKHLDEAFDDGADTVRAKRNDKARPAVNGWDG